MDMKKLEELENLANNGDVDAICEVGRIYCEGTEVEPNYGKAKYYLEIAAERGSQKANYYLGKMYYNGLGVGTDYGRAKYHFEKSAEANNTFSTYYLGKIYYWGDGVQKDTEKANAYKSEILHKPLYANQDTDIENFYSIQDFEKVTKNYVNDLQNRVVSEYNSLFGEE